MNTVKIKKAKIKDLLFLDVEFTEDMPGFSKKDTKLTCTVPIHADLIKSFENLNRHLAYLCDEIKAPKLKDFETAETPTFTARGFSIGGSDENEGVTISGSKDGLFGLVNLNTPFTKFEGVEYPFTSHLMADIEAAIYEVEQYLFFGKKAPDAQLSLFTEEAAASYEDANN